MHMVVKSITPMIYFDQRQYNYNRQLGNLSNILIKCTSNFNFFIVHSIRVCQYILHLCTHYIPQIFQHWVLVHLWFHRENIIMFSLVANFGKNYQEQLYNGCVAIVITAAPQTHKCAAKLYSCYTFPRNLSSDGRGYWKYRGKYSSNNRSIEITGISFKDKISVITR